MNLGSLIGYLGLDTKDWDRGLDDAQGSLKSFAAKGAVAAAAAGTAIAGAVGFAVAAGMDIEAANDKLAAQLGASGQYAADLGMIAGNLYSNAYGESIQQVNEALKGVLQSGLLPEDATNAQIESITAKALDLASVMELDVGEAASAAGQMVRTGLADNADQAMDILARGIEQGANQFGDLAETLSGSSATLAQFGLDGETSVGLINQSLKAGAPSADFFIGALEELAGNAGDSVEVFDSLGLSGESMAQKLTAGGPQAKGAVTDLLAALRNMQDPAARSTALVGLFGEEATAMSDALLSLDPSTAVAGLGEVGGAAERMGATLNDNASTNLESFKRKATDAFVTVIGGQVLPAVSGFASTMATQFGPALAAAKSAMEGLFNFLASHQTTVSIIAGIITAVLVPALIAWGVQSTIAGAKSLAAWLMAQAGAIGAGVSMAVTFAGVVAGWVLMGAQAMLQAARMAAAWLIAMGPIGWVIAAVVGIVALIVANWDTVVKWTRVAWAAVSAAVGAAWNWIKGAVSAALSFVTRLFLNFTGPGLIIKHWNSIVNFTRTAWAAVSAAVSGAWNALVGAVSGGVARVVAFMVGLPGRIRGALGGLGSLLVSAGGDLIRGMINGIKNMAGNVASAAINAAKAAVNGVKSFLGIASPSKVFTTIGEFTGQGFVNGLANMRPAVAAEMQQLADYRALLAISDDDSFAGNSANDANRGRPGYRQAEDGSWTGPLFQANTVNVIEGTPRDIAQQLDYQARTRGR